MHSENQPTSGSFRAHALALAFMLGTFAPGATYASTGSDATSPPPAQNAPLSSDDYSHDPLTGPPRDRVYFITGNDVDMQAPEILWSMWQLGNQMQANRPDSGFAVVFNGRANQLCQRILDLHARQMIKRLVLLGHSWGGQAAIDLTHCIIPQGVTVQLLVTLDSTQRPGHFPGNLILPNVLTHINYYETRADVGSFQNDHRQDGSTRGIQNILFNPGGWPAARAHVWIVNQLTYGEVLIADIKKALPQAFR